MRAVGSAKREGSFCSQTTTTVSFSSAGVRSALVLAVSCMHAAPLLVGATPTSAAAQFDCNGGDSNFVILG
jgi:hypothetical protein